MWGRLAPFTVTALVSLVCERVGSPSVGTCATTRQNIAERAYGIIDWAWGYIWTFIIIPKLWAPVVLLTELIIKSVFRNDRKIIKSKGLLFRTEFSKTLCIKYILTYKVDIPFPRWGWRIWCEPSITAGGLNCFGNIYHLVVLFKMKIQGSHPLEILI